MLIGVVIGCATFAVSASRVNAIKFRFDGSEYRSTFDRGPEELAILAAHGRDLAAACERLDVDKDAIIASQGEAAGSMHFILEGRVGIIVKMDDARSIRVRSLGPHTTIGEMGLITSQLRSATIQVEIPSVLYALSADAYERIKRENGALAQALLTYVIQVMAERLSFARKVIGVLRR